MLSFAVLLEVATSVVSATKSGQDRAASFARGDAHLLVLADGAGGTTGGAAAADSVVRVASEASPANAADCVRLLGALDQALVDVGQTTAIVVVVSESRVFGASVGDSSAWILDGSDTVDLTERQDVKPLLGSGRARPVGFGPVPLLGRLLLGSDGLFKYAPHQRIHAIVQALPLASVPDALVAAVRLPSGALQDDIAVIVAGRSKGARLLGRRG